MSDLYWPEDLTPAETEVRVQDAVGRHESTHTSFLQAVGRPGSRLEMAMRFQILSARARAQLQAIYAATRGGARAIWCRDHSYRQSDYHAAAELIASPTFESGLTGYTVTGSFSGAVKDRILRCTRIQNTGAIAGVVRLTNAITGLTAYKSYVFRALAMPGRGPYADLRLNAGSSAFASDYSSAAGASAGMLIHAFAPPATSVHLSVAQGINTAIADDFLEFAFLSFAPCALVDNAPNALLHSNSIGTSPWSGTRSSVTADAAIGPDGEQTMDSLNETTDNGTHYRTQTATKAAEAQDWTGRAYVKASNRSEVRIQIGESSANFAVFTISLTDGSVVNAASAAGTVTNARGAVVSKGNGIYEIFLTARIPSSITTTNAILIMPSVAGAAGYAGTGTQSAIYVGGVSYAQSSQPMRYGATTTTAAATGTKQSLGGGLHTKGWLASSTEYLKKGSQVQIGHQVQITEAPLDTDAAGRAFLPIPSVRTKPADNTPVIFVTPMLRLMPMEPVNGWTNRAGLFSDSDILLGEVG